MRVCTDHRLFVRHWRERHHWFLWRWRREIHCIYCGLTIGEP
jgi:hypothetical protein